MSQMLFEKLIFFDYQTILLPDKLHSETKDVTN
ncbi:hypothetical protein DES35_101338 [Schleiferia thermophila]|jgi:hypothetical protein|uniref:Uncharacterized protein n=1 Tax=Schleiferia thermophila TaxID=884107 RepID=A0A369A9H9_9FLAO|nr:hypothetical protein DES35_101338 [Schleiferia thermophila]